MKKILLSYFLLFPLFLFSQQQHVIYEDIPRFWKAYDEISGTIDTIKHINIIDSIYIRMGTPGLYAIMEARNYTAESFVYSIRQYPSFWNSVRENTLQVNLYASKIEKGIRQLNKLYPELKSAQVYFTIGALRTNGTTLNDKVLIGSELAMADEKTNVTQLQNDYSHLPDYFANNPLKNIVFLNVHEYVHTQQKTTIGNSLLGQTVIEGVAEFLACKALNIQSPNPQINFGKKNENKIIQSYTKEMFSPYIYNWIMNDTDNEFKMRDLGYYVGYAICEKYYDRSKNKKVAIREMIELDYNNEAELIRFVEQSGFFNTVLEPIKTAYENTRPIVTGIMEFKNNSTDVDASISTVTILFSQRMNTNARGFDYGPLGESNVLLVQRVIGFSEDKQSFSYEVKMEPGKRYQVLVSSRFMNEQGIPLKPFLIDITTN